METWKELDLLVLEYLEETHPLAAQVLRNNVNTALQQQNGVNILSPSLKDVYKTFQRNYARGRSDVLAPQTVAQQKIKNNPHELFISVPNIQFPDEILEVIISFLSVLDLKLWRTVAKKCNLLACATLRRTLQPIEIWSDSKMNSLLAVMKQRTQEMFPFSKVAFYVGPWINIRGTRKFGDQIGPKVTELSFPDSNHSKSSVVLHRIEQLLRRSTNLVKFCVHENRNGKNFERIQENAPPYSSTSNDFIRVDPKRLISWIGLLPKLKSLHCEFDIVVGGDSESSQNFLQILQVLSRLSYVAISISLKRDALSHQLLEQLSLTPARIHSLKLETEYPKSQWALPAKWLSRMSPSLTKLGLVREFNISGCYFPNLTTLLLVLDEIINVRIRADLFQLDPCQFPVLETFLLKALAEYYVYHLGCDFLVKPFESVHTLHLTVQYVFELSFTHAAFPNLTTLRLHSDCHESTITSIMEFFPSLVNLSIIGFADSEKTFSALTGGLDERSVIFKNRNGETIIGNYNGVLGTPNISNLQHLKRMEIGGNRMGGAVNALICLTALKLLVQLDFIGIYGLNDSGREVAEFACRELERLKWHKVVTHKLSHTWYHEFN